MRHSKAQREAAVARVKQLAGPKGQITPDQVVADAKKKSSPLHPFFEWDDSVAAQRYRIEQARELIQVVVFVQYGETRIAVPQYIRDPATPHGKQGYLDKDVLRTQEEVARAAVVEAAAVAAGHLQRTRNLAIVLGLEDEVGAILERFVVFQQRLETAA